MLAWEHQERSLLRAYARALGQPATGRGRRKERHVRRVDGHMSTIEAHPNVDDSSSPFSRAVGAVVLGGDYQGLGIARSVGRHGVPVVVVDDERSIARLSRYCESTSASPTCGDEARVVDDLLRIARRRGLEGWVLYPTRDETVAAIARNRERLSEVFRVPTAPWDAVRWAWDKRNTARSPSRWASRRRAAGSRPTAREVDQIDSEPPWAIKPAIKEHFFYATKAKAWRADSPEELRTLLERAWAIAGQGQMIVQELIPGDGRQQFAYCAMYSRAGRSPRWSAGAAASTRRTSAAPARSSRPSTSPRSRRCRRGSCGAIGYDGLVELEYKRDPRTGTFKLLDFNARTWGYHTIAPAAGVDFPYLLYRQALGQPVVPQRARPPACAGCACSPIFRPAASRSGPATSPSASTCARCAARTWKPSSAATIRCPGSPRLRCCRISPSNGGSERARPNARRRAAGARLLPAARLEVGARRPPGRHLRERRSRSLSALVVAAVTTAVDLSQVVRTLLVAGPRAQRSRSRSSPTASTATRSARRRQVDDDVVISPADGEIIYVRRSEGGKLPVVDQEGARLRPRRADEDAAAGRTTRW